MQPVLTAMLVTGSLLLAGCATARPTDSAETTEATVALLAEQGSYATEEILLHQAEEVLIRRCMSALGHRYVSTPLDLARGGSLTDDEDHPDLAARRIAGYSLDDNGATAGRGENDRFLATLSPAQQAAWQRALKGGGGHTWSLQLPSGHLITSPTDGCVTRSDEQLYGSLPAAMRAIYYPQDARIALSVRVKADPRYAKATDRWATCMRERGLPYRDPKAARQAMVDQYAILPRPPGLRGLEVTVAVADGECSLSAGRAAAAAAAFRDLLAAAPADTRSQLAGAVVDRQHAVAAAGRLTAG